MKGSIRGFGVVMVGAFILAAVVAGAMMFVAWSHNPQGEIHELEPDGALLVHWQYWVALGASWFVPVFVSVVALGGIVRACISFVQRRAVQRRLL